ncbi:MAG: energy-coupling factor transporter ATPase [Oscillospiraceae bacterium]|nr:energy-coupling factor transporter ATPase [Oscillospiraceae bacterium]
MSLLSVQNLIYGYSKGTPFETGALKGVSLDFEMGEIVAVIGHTGSGKSTLLQHLNGLLKPDSGDVLLNGESIYSSKEALRNCRFKVGLCFQYPEQQLFESTVYKDIAFGPKNMGLSEEEIRERVYQSINYVNLPLDYLEKSPFDLSGGEKRRVAIAGVLSMEPDVLILDEPTAGLDPVGKKMLLKLIEDYNKNTGSTVIFVSHNMDDVAAIAKRVIVMNKGEVALQGTVDEVYSQGEALSSLGLDVPEITSIFLKLKEAGYNLGKTEYTVDGAAKAILEFLGKEGKG